MGHPGTPGLFHLDGDCGHAQRWARSGDEGMACPHGAHDQTGERRSTNSEPSESNCLRECSRSPTEIKVQSKEKSSMCKTVQEVTLRAVRVEVKGKGRWQKGGGTLGVGLAWEPIRSPSAQHCTCPQTTLLPQHPALSSGSSPTYWYLEQKKKKKKKSHYIVLC